MSESVEKLLIRIDASTEQLRRELKAAEKSVDGTDKKVRGAQARMAKGWKNADKFVQQHGKKIAALGAVAIAGLGLAIKKVIANTSEQEKAFAQLEATIKATGGAAGKTAIELSETASALQKITVFGDEAIMNGQSLIATFKNIKGDNFDRTTRAVLDMATSMGTDLKSAAIQVGKALNDPALQMSALSRSGVTFTESQMDMAKAMQATGNMAGAQAIILKELESEFIGSAEAARNTLGGALLGLENSFNDLFEASADGSKDLTAAVQELEGTLNDPTTKKAFEDMSAGLLGIAVDAIEAGKAIAWLYRELNGMVGGEGNEPLLGDLHMELIGLENSLIAMEGASNGFFNGFRVRQKDIDEVKGKIKELNEEIDNHSYTVGAAAKKNQELLDSLQEVTVTATRRGEAALKTEKQIKAEAKAAEKLNKILAAAKKKIDDVTKSLDFEMAQLKRNEREQEQFNALQKAGITITDDSAAAIMEKAGALYDLQVETDDAAQAVVDAAEATEEATEAATQAAEDAVAPFNAALQEMAASIDSGFVDGWRDAFNGVEGGFKNFAEKMKDALINLLANMAHMAITRPIAIGLTTAMGGLMPTSAAAGGATPTATGTGISSVSGLLTSGFGAAGRGVYDTIGVGLSDMGFGGLSESAFTKAGSTTGLTMAADLGGGLLGGYLGGEVFGETSGIGATLGGFAGTLIPGIGQIPGLGSAIGAFVGTAIESLFQGDNDGDNRGRSKFDTATGDVNSFGEGKSFNQASVDAADELSNIIIGIADAFGGADLSGEIAIGNNTGIVFDGKSYGEDVDALLADVTHRIIQSATNISDGVKDMVKSFDGTTEELLGFVAAADGIYEAVKSNPVEQAMADTVAGIDANQRTMLDFYNEQATAVTNLIGSYDGSAESTVDLNDALQVSRVMAYELTLALLAMSDAITGMTESSAKFFRDTLLSEDDKQARDIARRTELRGLIEIETDPEKMLEWVTEFNRISRTIFDRLSPEAQEAFAEGFAIDAENVGEMALDLIGTTLSDLAISQDDINKALLKDVVDAGLVMKDAAADMGTHVATFGSLVADLVTRGITINIAGGSEVNA